MSKKASTTPAPIPDNKPEIPKRTNTQRAKDFNKQYNWDNDPKDILRSFGSKLKEVEEIKEPESKEGKKQLAKINKELQESGLFKQAIMLGEFDRQAIITEQVKPRYRPLVTQLARQLISDYGCETDGEKALAGMAAGAFGRWLELSSEFQSIGDFSFLSHERAHWYSMLSKEVDRAFKQYQQGLNALQVLKNPLAGANIRANNAYIGQNQQFNTVPQQDTKATIVEDKKGGKTGSQS